MKKLIPYILAYLIVAVGTTAVNVLLSHGRTSPVPPNSVTVFSSLPHSELAAKLDQAGFHQQMNIRTTTLGTHALVFHFAYYAVVCAAFAGLAAWFQRVFRAEHPSQSHAA